MNLRVPLHISVRYVVALVCSLTFVFGTARATAATLTVTNTNDSGAGSLRQAIADAVSGDTIVITVTGTITLTSGELAFSKSLAIQGPGANLLTISGNNASRVFLITGGANSLSGLSIANGKAGPSGAVNAGGGIAAFNCNLTISNCAIANNQAVNAGGVFLAQGIFILFNTTISGNTAEFQGAGVNLQDTTTTMTNCTISGNASQKSHGGILNGAINRPVSLLTLTNCTITNNTSIAPFGAVWTNSNFNTASATTTLRNTLVANNSPQNFLTSPTTVVPVPNAVLTSLGNNLDSDGTSGFSNGNNGNLVGTIANPLNALLGPLANNGGSTQTHILLPGSPAIDKGSNAGVPIDQRNIARPIDDPSIANAAGGDGSDIGAVEVGTATAPSANLVICFADASRWCNRLMFIGDKRNFAVVVPGVNFNQALPVFSQNLEALNPLVRSYLGCGGYMKMDVTSQLIASYISAQLSLQAQVPFWWVKLKQQPLLLHVRPLGGQPNALPATFSGGPVPYLTDFHSLQDLFDATDWVSTKGTLADQQALLAIYRQLNSCLNY